MAIQRYHVVDAYTSEELRLNYNNSDAKGRIEMLKQLYQLGEPWLPEPVALMAIEDPHIEVRAWLARHAERVVDPLTERFPGMSRPPVGTSGGRRKLKADPEPFVRACLYENPHCFTGLDDAALLAMFREATQMERLALVRNPYVRRELIESIFDLDDQTLGLDFGSRLELAMAFLTNSDVLNWSFKVARQRNKRVPGGGFLGGAHEFFLTLWELAAKWSDPSSERQSWPGLRSSVYQHIGLNDDLKAELYQGCDPDWRREILSFCDRGADVKTLKLGLKDSDPGCRLEARKKMARPAFTIRESTKLTLLSDAQRVLTGILLFLILWSLWPTAATVVFILYVAGACALAWWPTWEAHEYLKWRSERRHLQESWEEYRLRREREAESLDSDQLARDPQWGTVFSILAAGFWRKHHTA